MLRDYIIKKWLLVPWMNLKEASCMVVGDEYTLRKCRMNALYTMKTKYNQGLDEIQICSFGYIC